jgi:folate-dependent phosphoribosylglycinamide formyltransferase PurN
VVAIEAGDTEESLSARILEQEHELYPEAINRVLEDLGRGPSDAQKPVQGDRS